MFKPYPKVNYDLYSDGSSVELTDITRAVALSKNSLPDDALLYTLYSLDNAERPDILSYKLYNDTQYYWTFFIINDFLHDGYNAWQLSSHQFERLMEKEYSRYSAMTPEIFYPNDLNGTNLIDFSCIPFDSKYLPYLKLTDAAFGVANIVRYDTERHTLIIDDIHRMIGTTRIEISRNSFINGSDLFKIQWVNETETPAVLALKNEWLNTIFENIKIYDAIGLSEKNRYNTTVDSYILGKNVKFNTKTNGLNNKTYRWDYYQNAPYQYLDLNGGVLTAYDVLTSTTITTPTYKSYLQYEEEINESKRQLRVIRPDYIRQFSEQYYDTLLA
jgi:hypothetical protein